MGKVLECKLCSAFVPDVSDEATEVTCSDCVAEKYWEKLKVHKKQDSSYPRGWRFMKQYVHKDGTVYFRGVEQKDLKGTLPPTVITPKEPKEKKTKAQRRQEKEKVLVELGTLKKKLKGETRKTYAKKLQSKINKLQRQL